MSLITDTSFLYLDQSGQIVAGRNHVGAVGKCVAVTKKGKLVVSLSDGRQARVWPQEFRKTDLGRFRGGELKVADYKLIFSVIRDDADDDDSPYAYQEIEMLSPFIPEVGTEVTLDGPLHDEFKVERVIHFFNKKTKQYEHSYIFLE